MELATFRRLLILLFVAAVLVLFGRALLRTERTEGPSSETVVMRIREVARLETLDVAVYKKIDFSPDPPRTDALWKDVLNWARYSLDTPRGRALVFGEVHYGYDFSGFDGTLLRIEGTRATVRLPPPTVHVELRPGETEIINSNLDSEQTAKLLELAREAFEREARANPVLLAKARASAERSLHVLLLTLGFKDVTFEGSEPPPVFR